MLFQLTILGCNSAIPASNRNPTAQVLNVQNKLYLIDCGEGTQSQMSKYKIKRSKIDQVFISHLHGDHVLGLIGLLNSFSLGGRKTPMDLYGPFGLQEFVETNMRLTGSHSTFPLHIHEIDTTTSHLVYENERLTVYSIPLIHRIATTGYLFKEKSHRQSIKIAQIEKYGIHFSHINSIKEGADYKDDKRTIPNSELTSPAPPARSYAYCSDTVYSEAIVPIIKGVDLLYHETTFLHQELKTAEKTKHTTALQAAMIAKKAAVKQLITGHYSSRYVDLIPIKEEAQQIFENTVLGKEGEVYDVPFKKT